MSTFQSIATKHGFTGFIAIGPVDARDGLSRLQDRIANAFSDSSVTYEDGKVFVQLRDVDALSDNTIGELVMDALADAFPELAREPPTINDEVLGELTWDVETSGFQGQVILDRNEVDLLILAPVEPAPLSLVQRVRDVVLEWHNWWQAMQLAIIEEGLTLYNDNWLASDEAGDGRPLTADQFLRRLSPFALHANADLSFNVYFGADGMFTEHGMTINVSADDLIVAYLE